MASQTAIVTLCVDKSIDQVAPYADEHIATVYDLEPTDVVIDGFEVRKFVDESDNRFFFVRTHKVMPHDYPHYVPLFKQEFPEAECVVVLNWHEGIEAPDDILTIHVNGDIPSGIFARVDPAHIRNVLLALERYRIEYGLSDYRVLTEPSHWSGLIHDQDPEQIRMLDIPIYDLEIGSSVRCWQDKHSIEVLLKSVTRIFDSQDKFNTLLCVGGMHFMDGYAQAVLENKQEFPVSLTHTFHTKWIENSDYLEEEGKSRFRAAIDATIGGIDGIVFHQNIKGPYKQLLRDLADEYNVNAFHHKSLRKLDPTILAPRDKN